MKKAIIILGSVLLSAIILISCGANVNKENANISESQIQDTAKANNTTVAEVKEEVATPAHVAIKLFFKTKNMSGYENPEDFEDVEQEVAERTEFDKDNSYTFCYDSEEFDHVKLVGTGKQISIEIKEENKTIFSKNNFEVTKEGINFTTKDFNFTMGNDYLIIVKQNENVLTKGKVNSEGCM